jgi:formylglycine-generating enzyme
MGSFTNVGGGGATARQFTDYLALSDGQSYTYRMRAVGRNNQSSYTQSSVLAASLAAPTNLTITSAKSKEIRLQWQDNSNIERGFRVEQSTDGTNFVLAGTAGPNATSATVAGAFSPAESYSFQVRAVSSTSQGKSSSVATREADMVLVAGGTFQMGSAGVYSDERPVHSVTLSSFYIDKYEVTVAQYRAFCTVTGRRFPSSTPSWGWNDNDPMVYVDSHDATAYAAWAGKRLPTEAEWEFAARGGNKSKGYYYSGSNVIGDIAWYVDNSNSTAHTVGLKYPNELGIYDMSGNVWEWVQDYYGPYPSGQVTNPTGPTSGAYVILRGGSWIQTSDLCSVTYRYEVNYFADNFAGFRCAQDF